jgi:Domain of unknown function (DUF4410)
VDRSRQFFLLVPLLMAVFFAPGFAFAQMPDRQQGSAPSGYPGGPPGPSSMPDNSAPPAMPERTKTIYVTDFELEAGAVTADANAAPNVSPQGNPSAPPGASPPKPNASGPQAQHIVKLMSDDLLKDFAKAGYTTKLLHPSDSRPDDGFLITGVFTQVGPDNRLRRAVLGSGQAAETLQLYVAARDLAHFSPPLYQADPTDTSGAQAGAVIVVNPNANAVKFSMEADITDKEIKQTAQRISAELVKRINAAVKSESDPLNRYAKP